MILMQSALVSYSRDEDRPINLSNVVILTHTIQFPHYIGPAHPMFSSEGMKYRRGVCISCISVSHKEAMCNTFLQESVKKGKSWV